MQRTLILLLFMMSLISCNDATAVNIKFYDPKDDLIGGVTIEVIHYHLNETPRIAEPKRQKVMY